jgi:hypothetical protein
MVWDAIDTINTIVEYLDWEHMVVNLKNSYLGDGQWLLIATVWNCVYIYMYVCIYILYTQSSKVGDRLGDPNFGFKGQGGIRPVVIVDPAGRGSQFSPKSIEVGMEPGKCLKFKDIFGIII